MNTKKIIDEIKIYVEEMDTAVDFYEELSKLKNKSKIEYEELLRQKEFTKKEFLKASFKLDKTIKKIEIKEKPKK